MIIDKYVLNGSEEYTVTDTFYFTLFRDEELKIPYEQFETKKLDLNDEAHGTVTFEKLPYGVHYLAETDADGKPVGDGFDYEVKIEKKQFTISEINKKETIRIDNCIAPDTPGGKNTPKTGDDTLIWPYVTMMLAALWLEPEVFSENAEENAAASKQNKSKQRGHRQVRWLFLPGRSIIGPVDQL